VTVAPTPDATSASTAAAGGPNQILRHGPAPNPSNGTGCVAVELNGPADSVVLRVYSKAMVCIGFSSIGAQAPGWTKVPLPLEMALQPDGLYYYQVKSIRQGAENLEPGTGKFMVLR
jgi:hypothetical protein